MLRVLVVEDNPDTAETMCFVLKLWGHSPLIARDGPAGIQAAEEFCPDVMLLDIGLPLLDGYEVARRVRQLPGKQPVIICISGYGQDEDRRRSREAGCDHHLLKPADPDVLAQLLRTIEAGTHPAA
jgi:two-component system CheB/CheR fusion protein